MCLGKKQVVALKNIRNANTTPATIQIMAVKQTVIISKKITFTNVNLKNFVYTIIGSAVRHNAMSYLRNVLI